MVLQVILEQQEPQEHRRQSERSEQKPDTLEMHIGRRLEKSKPKNVSKVQLVLRVKPTKPSLGARAEIIRLDHLPIT